MAELKRAALRGAAVAAFVAAASTGIAAAATSPTVQTGVATNQTQVSAVLHGTVNPNGASTSYTFQWGPTTALGSSSSPATAGGTKDLSVSATATGLTPGTTYYYRLVASNSYGQSLGATRTFKTGGNPPPGATTGGAENVERNGVTLTGVVYPNNQTTTYFFQYGLSSLYSAQTLPLTVSGAAPMSVSATLSGLQSGTVFHYRLVVEHSTAVTENAGQDEVFQTLPLPRPRPRVTSSTSPRRGRTPLTITTSGRIHDPGSILPALGCAGRVRVTMSVGRRTLRSTLAAVQPNCTFAAAEAFRRLPGRGAGGRTVRLTVRVRFLGNGYLAPSTARSQTVTLR